MAMNTPVHPGAIVREDCLKPLGLSVTEGARRLGIGRQTLSNQAVPAAARASGQNGPMMGLLPPTVVRRSTRRYLA